MARICFYGVSTVCLRKSVMIERTKDKTMIVLTPAMVAVGCAEGIGLVESRWCFFASIQKSLASVCDHV